ncbi:MAG: AcrR family transcriptional regulator [Gammaproteobacteria bacterium]|jgi:AcrR family transcriptional regulator
MVVAKNTGIIVELIEMKKRPVGRPRADGKPQVSRGSIFIAATGLIAKYGYAGTSLRMIADELDIQAPSILNLFKSKERLLIELMAFLSQFSLEFYEALNREKVEADIFLYKTVYEEVKAVSGANRDVTAIFYLPELRLPAFKEAQEHRAKMIRHYKSQLSIGVEKGLFCPMNEELRAEQVFQLTETAIIALNPTQFGSVEQQAKSTADFVMLGLLVNPKRLPEIMKQALAIPLKIGGQ